MLQYYFGREYQVGVHKVDTAVDEATHRKNMPLDSSNSDDDSDRSKTNHRNNNR